MPNASRYAMRTRETGHGIVVLIAYASSEGPGEPARMRSLARALAARIHKLGFKKESTQCDKSLNLTKKNTHPRPAPPPPKKKANTSLAWPQALSSRKTTATGQKISPI